MLRFSWTVLFLGLALSSPTRWQASESAQSASQDPPDVHALLQAAVEALGSPETFDRLRSIEFVGPSSTHGQGEGDASTEMLFVFPPDRGGLWMHSKHRSENGLFVRTLAGERAWAPGIGVLPADLHRDAIRYASTKLLTLLRYRQHPEATTVWRGTQQLGDDVVDLVEVTLFGFASVLEIVRSTSRVAAVRFRSSEIQEGVKAKEVRRAYSDYRQVGLLRLPFLQEVSLDGEPFSRWQLDEIRLDPDYDPALFSPPESAE